MSSRCASCGHVMCMCPAPKVRHCDECRHWYEKMTQDNTPRKAGRCAMNYNPRFYSPKWIEDRTWGWKRKCAEWELRNDLVVAPDSDAR